MFPVRWARTDKGKGVGGCSYKSVGQSKASILVWKIYMWCIWQWRNHLEGEQGPEIYGQNNIWCGAEIAHLGNIDAVGRVSHRSPTRGAATDAATRASVLHLIFFCCFFFLRIRANSASIRANLASICADLCWTRQIRPESSCIGQIGLYQLAAETDRNRLKSALNHVGTVEIGFEWGPNILNLSFLNFILNICCFFCVSCLWKYIWNEKDNI